MPPKVVATPLEVPITAYENDTTLVTFPVVDRSGASVDVDDLPVLEARMRVNRGTPVDLDLAVNSVDNVFELTIPDTLLRTDHVVYEMSDPAANQRVIKGQVDVVEDDMTI